MTKSEVGLMIWLPRPSLGTGGNAEGGENKITSTIEDEIKTDLEIRGLWEPGTNLNSKTYRKR